MPSKSDLKQGASEAGSTEWSLVIAAGDRSDASDAMNRICQKYWKPMYVHIRKTGIPAADAEDVTQRFFVFLIERQWINHADRSRGKFRAFLHTLLNHFLSNYRRETKAEKRSGLRISIDTAEGERAVAAVSTRTVDPAIVFDRAWARTVLQAALDRLGREQSGANKRRVFEAVKPFLAQAASAQDYDRLVARLGLPRGQIAASVHRLSRRFAALIRAEVAETLVDRSEIDAELRHLLQITGP